MTKIVAYISLKMRTRSELNAEGFACAKYRVTNSNTRSFLIDLNSSFIGVDTNNLCGNNAERQSGVALFIQPIDIFPHTSYELVVTDSNKLIHSRTSHVLGNDNGTRDAKDLTKSRFIFLIANLGQVTLRILESTSHGSEEEDRVVSRQARESVARSGTLFGDNAYVSAAVMAYAACSL